MAGLATHLHCALTAMCLSHLLNLVHMTGTSRGQQAVSVSFLSFFAGQYKFARKGCICQLIEWHDGQSCLQQFPTV